MKAILCKSFADIDALTYEEVPSPATVGKNQVLISVKAAGVNFPDILIIEGKYQVRPALPFSPGGEVAGIVKAVGEAVSHVKVGDSVIGGTWTGGYAEESVADAERVFRIPESMNFAEAAGLLTVYGTSYHALVDRAKLQAGETLLVLGAGGGVGLAAVDIGKALGAKVIACASSPEKLAVCKEYGADETIQYTTEDLKERVKQITGGKGVDVIYDPVGGDFTEKAFRTIGWGGRHLIVGFAEGNIPNLPMNLPLLKSASVVGVFWGSFTATQPALFQAGLQNMLQMFEAGKLKAHICATYPLEQAKEAMRLVANRQVIGKVVLTM
ncbi:MAG: NADPH:quinone oxidoreductase family protein [Bacteroidetes bacterium]|nr:MAG: NADPH:quinone oxidoreductase family protein [Bacteroidota bacterium]